MSCRKLAVLLATLGLIVGAGSSKAEELDLELAVQLALSRNPAFQGALERRQEVAGGITEAKAEAYPQLTLTSAWSQSRNPALLNSPDFEDIIDLFPDFEPSVQELYNVGVDLRQPLFTAGKVGAAIKLAKTVVGVVEAQIATARLDTALAAAEAYYRLLAAQKALDTIEIQRRVREESLAMVKAAYDLADATRLELLRSQAALAEIEPAVARTQGLVEVTESELRVVLNLAPDLPLTVKKVEAELPDARALSDLLQIAVSRRPEIVDLQLQQEVLVLQERITLADGRPQLELTGRYGSEARLPENIADPLYQDWRVVVGFTWELFDGGRRKGQVAQLRSQKEQLRWQLMDLLNRVTLEIRNALTEYETAQARWQASEASAEAAREASRVAQDSYYEGVAIQNDWLSAQEQETQAEVLLVDAYYSALIQAARLSRSLGQLPTESWEESSPFSPYPEEAAKERPAR
jgi:HAE1 family hydrophobic/amphiphilic exporter-1